MKRVTILLVALAALMTLALAVPKASAEELYRESAEVNAMGHKLSRGFLNVIFGWMEVPKQIGKKINETDPLTGMVVGGVEGLSWGFCRTAAGFYEVATFPFPCPNRYEPIIDPEFVLKDFWGAEFPVISDPSVIEKDDAPMKSF
jgi:putative exosortase-associated protein (TIGR04073 family)